MSDAPLKDTRDEPLPPRRIAFCITDLDVGGAEQCLVNVVCGLDRRVWSPHVYCLSRRGALVDRLDEQGVPYTCLNWRQWRDAWQVFRLARMLRAWRPELLQTFLFHGNIVGRIAGAMARVPVVVSGIRVAEREKKWHVQLERLTRRWVTHHVCVSQGVADFSIREGGLRPETVTVIPNGVDVARFATAQPMSHQELGAPHGTHWIIAVGRLHSQKGHGLLIDAAAPVLRAHPQWRLMIVGDGDLRNALQGQIDALGCREQIVMTGFRNDVPRLMTTASLLVLPSLWEGQPNVVLEAMAVGLPVIATDVEGVRELITPGVTGVIVEPGNEAALQTAILELVESDETRTRMHNATQSTAATLVTTQFATARYAGLYLQLLQKQGLLNT